MEAYHVESFGCRANQSDGEAIAAGLNRRGLPEALNAESAGLVILNTCSVTAEADRTARAYIRRIRRGNPQARIVVTGCYAQRAPEEMAELEGVDTVIGNSHKALVPQVAADLLIAVNSGESSERRSRLVEISSLTRSSAPVFVDESFAHSELASLPLADDARLTRPNLKVQDGCGNRCSFCIIPTTRGPSRSVALDACLEKVRRFVASGGQELVLSGINLGHWGRDLALKPARGFVDLVDMILRQTSLPRLRLSSIEPMDWTALLLALFREFATGRHPRLAPHAHLPLQSGSDTILRKMHRRYRPWHYAERTNAIREALPGAAIGADVMVGFPGETDALFAQSYNFIEEQPFTYLHLFPFSARPGTPGWELHRTTPVAAEAVAERMAALRALAEEKGRTFRRRFAGQAISAVTLQGGRDGHTPALSANFLKVNLCGAFPANRMVEAHITADRDNGTISGRVILEPEGRLLHRMKQKQIY